jgi:hypothetical protein
LEFFDRVGAFYRSQRANGGRVVRLADIDTQCELVAGRIWQWTATTLALSLVINEKRFEIIG